MNINLSRTVLRSLLLAALNLTVAGLVSAAPTPLPPGATVDVGSGSFGGALANSGSSSFTGIFGQIGGTLSWEVRSSDPNNTLGGLTFAYRFDNAKGKDDSQIDLLSIKGFGGFTTQVAFMSFGEDSVAPDTAHRSHSGKTIQASFEDGVERGEVSSWFIVYTDAPGFEMGRARLFDTDGMDAASAMTAIPVPEPETYAMLIAGLGFLGFIARRRRQVLSAAV